MPSRHVEEVMGKRIEQLRPWTHSEDEDLVLYCKKYPDNWVKIASFFRGHTEKDCRNRYNYLQANKQGKWTEDETKKLVNLHTKYGDKWAIIARHFRDRNATQIKDKMRTIKKNYNEQTKRDIEDKFIERLQK